MIVQIINPNANTVKSGHIFEDDCPDRINYGINKDRNTDKVGAANKSGHRTKNADNEDVNNISGHLFGHGIAIVAIRLKKIINLDRSNDCSTRIRHK